MTDPVAAPVPATVAVVAPAVTLAQVQDVVKVVNAADPALEAASQAAVVNAGPLGTVAVTAVTFAAAHFGLALDGTTSGMIAGVILLGASYIAHNAPMLMARYTKGKSHA